MVSKNRKRDNHRWSLETLRSYPSTLLVICPKCGEIGRLYFSRKIGWYVKHGTSKTHSVPRDAALEVPLHDPRMNLIHYMGGDSYLLPYIAKMIPPHHCYVEVFGGGAPLLLNKPPSRVEVYNDIDGNLVNLFRVIRDRPGDFLREIWHILYSREMYYDMLNAINNEDDPVRRAVMYYAIIRMSWSGKYGKGFSTSKTNNKARIFFNAVDRVRDIHERLKNVVVERLGFDECIKRYDSDKTFFYLDPPHIYYATEKGDDYYAEGFSDSDYMKLLDMLTKVKGKWLLKQNYIPYAVEWAKENGNSFTAVRVIKSSSLNRGHGSREKMSVLFIANYTIV